jgi:hypothetical protein
MIDTGRDSEAAVCLEGWRMINEIERTSKDFIPVIHRKLQRLISVHARSPLTACKYAKKYIGAARFYLPFRNDYIDLMKRMGYDSEFFQEVESLGRDFPSSLLPLKHMAEYYIENDAGRSLELYGELIKKERTVKNISAAVRLCRDKGDYAGALRLIGQYDYDNDLIKEKIDVLIDAGDIDRAKSVINDAMSLKDDPAYRLKLGLIELIRDGDPAAHWKAVLKENPSNFHLEEFLRYLAGGKLTNPFENYSARDGDLAPPGTGEKHVQSSVILYRGRVFRLNSDGGSMAYCDDVIYLGDQKGIEKWGEYKVPYRGELHPVRIRAYHADGSYSDSYNVQKINGDSYINLSSLKEGTTVRLSYILVNPVTEPRRSEFFSVPPAAVCDYDDNLRRFFLAVIAPKSMTVNFFPGGGLKVESKELDGSVIYSAELKNHDPVSSEEFMGGRLNYLPFFAFSTMTDMGDLTAWYNGLLRGVFDADEDFCKKFSGRDAEDTLRRVYDFAAREIELKGGTMFFPERAADVLYNKYGTAEDKAVLAKAILDRLGMTSYIALAAREGQPDPGTFVSPGIFSDVLLCAIPDDKPLVWMDFSSRHFAVGTVDESLAGRSAVVLIGDRHEIRKIESSGDGVRSGKFTTVINRDGGAKFNMELVYAGISGKIRKYFKNADRREEVINRHTGDIFPLAGVDSFSFENIESYHKPFKITVKGDSPSCAAKVSKGLMLQPVLNRSEIYQYIQYSDRKHPLVISEPVNDSDIYSYKFPAGYRRFSIDSDTEIKCGFGAARITLRKMAGSDELYVTRVIKMRKAKISPSDYREFVDFCLNLRKAENRNLLITAD